MEEEKRTEIFLVQANKEEVKELVDFMNTLNSYEKREFMGIMYGAKLVKNWQAATKEANKMDKAAG